MTSPAMFGATLASPSGLAAGAGTTLTMQLPSPLPPFGSLIFVVLNMSSTATGETVTPPVNFVEIKSLDTGLSSRGAARLFMYNTSNNTWGAGAYVDFTLPSAYKTAACMFIVKSSNGRRMQNIPVAADVQATSVGGTTHSLPASSYGGSADSTTFHMLVSQSSSSLGTPDTGWSNMSSQSLSDGFSAYCQYQESVSPSVSGACDHFAASAQSGVAFTVTLTEQQVADHGVAEAASSGIWSQTTTATVGFGHPAVAGDVVLIALVGETSLGPSIGLVSAPVGFVYKGRTLSTPEISIWAKTVSGAAGQQESTRAYTFYGWSFSKKAAIAGVIIQNSYVEAVGSEASGSGAFSVPAVTLATSGRAVVFSSTSEEINGAGSYTASVTNYTDEVSSYTNRHVGAFTRSRGSGSTGTASYTNNAPSGATAIMVGLNDVPTAPPVTMPLLHASN